ncbi:hypothetical protein, partial [Escherichia coli]|uniref:hypothetical protein n=1 Tax=Escherichia coli TaxID=562 RepID=UPI003F50C2BB
RCWGDIAWDTGSNQAFDGVSVWQRYTTTGKSETTQGRTFERVYAGSTWTEWREVYNSFRCP